MTVNKSDLIQYIKRSCGSERATWSIINMLNQINYRDVWQEMILFVLFQRHPVTINNTFFQ